MDCRIIMDSVGDRTEEMKAEKTVRMVPLTVIIDGKEYRDDLSLLCKLRLFEAVLPTPFVYCGLQLK